MPRPGGSRFAGLLRWVAGGALLLLLMASTAMAESRPPLPCTPVPGYPVPPLAESAPPEKVTWLRQVPIHAARVRGVPRSEPLDGCDSSTLPLVEPLEVRLVRSALVSYLELRGAGTLALGRAGRVSPGVQLEPVARLLLSEPEKERRFSIEPVDGTMLAEVRLYEAAEEPLPETALAMALASQEKGAAAITLSTGALAQPMGVTAVLLELAAATPIPFPLRVRLTHSAETDRTWFEADIHPQADAGSVGGRWIVVLDPPDIWCEAGEHLVLSVTPLPEAGAGPPDPAAFKASVQARAALVPGTEQEVGIEFALSRLQWLDAWYAAHAVDAPWERPGWSLDDPAAADARRWLEVLSRWQPRHPATIAYTSRLRRLRSGNELPAAGPANAPAWARLARQLLKRTQDVAYWWNSTRYQKDGLYGGDPAGDAALVERLATVPLIAGHPVLLRSTRAGCEGLWRAMQARATAGNAGADPEAALAAWVAELPAGERERWLLAITRTQSLLLLADPGNATPLRRLLPFARALSEWATVNPRGHRHLRGAPSGAEGALVPVTPERPGSVVAAGPALAFFWHSGHPGVGRILSEWACAWAADILSHVDPEEPGRLPAAIDPATCGRLDTGARPSAREKNLLRRFLLDIHRVSGQKDLLRPVALAVAAGDADPVTAALWRAQGHAEHDEQIARDARGADDLRAYAAWIATRNKQFVVDGLQHALERLENERYLATEANPPPEALEIPGDLLLRSLYLGGCATWQGGMPRVAVTWENIGVDFAAFVTESRTDALKVLLYHFRPEARPVQMRLWALRPGQYQLEVGPDDDYDDEPDRVTERRVVEVERGVALPVMLPAQRPYVLRLVAKSLRPLAAAPDVALCADEVALSPDRRRVSVVVHNFGTAPAIKVRLTVTDTRRRVIGSGAIASLSWPENLKTAAARVEIPLVTPAPEAFRVTATLASPELSTANNSVAVYAR